MDIPIAMAACNGSRFIAEQLASIAHQSCKQRELVVCDDCSDDNTVEIVERFAAEAGFPVRLFQKRQFSKGRKLLFWRLDCVL